MKLISWGVRGGVSPPGETFMIVFYLSRTGTRPTTSLPTECLDLSEKFFGQLNSLEKYQTWPLTAFFFLSQTWPQAFFLSWQLNSRK